MACVERRPGTDRHGFEEADFVAAFEGPADHRGNFEFVHAAEDDGIQPRGRESCKDGGVQPAKNVVERAAGDTAVSAGCEGVERDVKSLESSVAERGGVLIEEASVGGHGEAKRG